MSTYRKCNFWNVKDQFKSHPKLTVFHMLLCVISLISLVCIFTASIWEPSGISGDYKFWTECLYGSLTLLIISYNLMKFIDVETIKGLSDLRRQLNEGENKKVHSKLMADSDKAPNEHFYPKIQVAYSSLGCASEGRGHPRPRAGGPAKTGRDEREARRARRGTT